MEIVAAGRFTTSRYGWLQPSPDFPCGAKAYNINVVRAIDAYTIDVYLGFDLPNPSSLSVYKWFIQGDIANANNIGAWLEWLSPSRVRLHFVDSAYLPAAVTNWRMLVARMDGSGDLDPNICMYGSFDTRGGPIATTNHPFGSFAQKGIESVTGRSGEGGTWYEVISNADVWMANIVPFVFWTPAVKPAAPLVGGENGYVVTSLTAAVIGVDIPREASIVFLDETTSANVCPSDFHLLAYQFSDETPSDIVLTAYAQGDPPTRSSTSLYIDTRLPFLYSTPNGVVIEPAATYAPAPCRTLRTGLMEGYRVSPRDWILSDENVLAVSEDPERIAMNVLDVLGTGTCEVSLRHQGTVYGPVEVVVGDGPEPPPP